VDTYVHMGGRIGVMVEISAEQPLSRAFANSGS
jgi:translation elongation factor EF-Ts